MPISSPFDKVLQVVSSLGGSVVAVHHIDPAPPPRRGPAPRTLAIAAALCLIAATLAFARGVAVAADNEAALIEATAAGRAAELRPRRLGVGHDLVAFGGLFAGILCAAGALALARAPRPRRGLSIGESEAADIAWDGVACADLVRGDGSDLVIDVPGGATAVLTIDDLEAEVDGAVSLPDGDRLTISRGPAALSFAWTARPSSKGLGAAAEIDQRSLAYAGATAAAFALLLALIWNIPPDRGSLSVDPGVDERRLVALTRAPAEDPLHEQRDRDPGESAGDPSKGEPASAGLEGDMGTPDEQRTSGKAKIAKISDGAPTVAHRDVVTPAEARNAGILKILAANPQYISHLSSTDDFTNGLDETTIRGTMVGDAYNPSHGMWDRGWGGRVRFSNSPYSRDMGTIKVGLIPSSGGDRGDRYGDGGPMREHRGTGPTVKFDHAKSTCAVAGCDKQLIRRYIKKHRARFRYCYERALLRRPELSGTVHTRFVISGTGKVQGASAGGIGDRELEGCVASVLSAIKFPVVAGGAMAAVKYPFHFHHAGG